MSDKKSFKLFEYPLSLIESLELIVFVVGVSVTSNNRDMRNAHRDVFHFIDGFVVKAERALFFEPFNRKPLWNIVLKVYFVNFAKDSGSATAPNVEVAIGVNGSTVGCVAGNFILIHQVNYLVKI